MKETILLKKYFPIHAILFATAIIFLGCENTANTNGNTDKYAWDNTFEGCASLDFDAAFFANIEKIGASAFKGSGITSFTIPQKITQLGLNVFENCVELVSVDLSALGESNLNTIGNYMFAGCSKLSKLTLPATGIGTIGTSTFSGCSSLVSVTLPSTLKGNTGTGPIGVSTFENCTNLETVTWMAADSTNVAFAINAFKGCESLTTFTVPEGVQRLINVVTAEKNAPFYECVNLSSITLPSSLTGAIPTYFFAGFENLTEITILKSSTAVTLNNVNAFTETPFASAGNDAHIYVPDDTTVTAYKNANRWKDPPLSDYISVKPADQGE
jgi:hypothetical protein